MSVLKRYAVGTHLNRLNEAIPKSTRNIRFRAETGFFLYFATTSNDAFVQGYSLTELRFYGPVNPLGSCRAGQYT